VRPALLIALLAGCHKLFSLQEVELAADAAVDAGPTCFEEHFDGTLADALIHWDQRENASCSVDVSNGVLAVTLPTTPCYAYLSRNERVALPIGGTVSVHVPVVAPEVAVETFLNLSVDDTNMYRFYKADTSLEVRVRVAGVDVVDEYIPYDATAHAYWRIRRDETAVLFETSVNRRDWTTRASVYTSTLAVDSITIQLGAGVYGSLSAAIDVKPAFDDLAFCTP
jgi:hypothetical protein